MRVSREKAAENRERIIDAASALFRAKGFGGIGVADIMKAADLTHGGFYGHFASKDDLVAQASRNAPWRGGRQIGSEVAAQCAGRALCRVAQALSVAAPSRRSRPGLRLRSAGRRRRRAAASRCSDAFADGLEPLIDILAKAAPGRSKAARRRKAVAAMAGLVGALLLARAVGKGELSDEILEATRRELLAAGGR